MRDWREEAEEHEVVEKGFDLDEELAGETLANDGFGGGQGLGASAAVAEDADEGRA